MEHLKDLKDWELKALLIYPVYICLLASNSEIGLDEKEKKVALRLSHVKTFSSDPRLMPFYQEAEKYFEESLEKLSKELPKEHSARAAAIQLQLEKLEVILKKLDTDFADLLRKSMRVYKDQVSRAHHHVLEYFIFPMPIQGLTD